MDTIQKTKAMVNPSSDGWQTILRFIEDITPWLTIGALLWKGIDKVFKYFSDARDSELRKIVHDEMKPQIENLSDKIEVLSESIFALRGRIQ